MKRTPTGEELTQNIRPCSWMNFSSETVQGTADTGPATSVIRACSRPARNSRQPSIPAWPDDQIER